MEQHVSRRTRRRDRRRERRQIHADPTVNRILRTLVRIVLKTVFHVRTENLHLIHRQRGAFLLLGNHTSVLDPLLVGIFSNRPIYFVASDSQFRSPLLSFVFNLVGVIPKTKVVADLDTVKKIVTVKRNGGIIGIFPEGQSSWDGRNLPIVKATDKLVKSLKIPVFTVSLPGAYFSWPRWARRFRRGKIVVRFRKLLSAADMKSMTVDEVGASIRRALTFDATSEQEQATVHFRGARRAEYLERTLFVCPACETVGSLHSHGQRLTCSSCGYEVRLNAQGFFEARSGELRYRTIPAWNEWQLERYRAYIEAGTGTPTKPLISEPGVFLRQGYKTQPLTEIGTGPMMLYSDRIEIACAEERAPRVFTLARLEGINVQNNEHLEFYFEDSLYRVSTLDPRGNTYKWDWAVRYLQQRERAPQR